MKRSLTSPEIQQEKNKVIAMEENGIEELKKMKNPQVVDIIPLLCRLFETSKSNEVTLKEMQKSLNNMQVEIDSSKQDIGNLQTKSTTHDHQINVLYQKTCSNNTNINYLMQSQVEDEIVITGFKAAPDLNTTLPKLFTLLNAPIEDISFNYTQTNNNKSRVIVGFKGKAQKINFMQKAIKHGKIEIKQLLTNSTDAGTVNISNKLSKFNNAVRSKLLELRKAGTIIKLRFRHSLYEYLEKSDGSWIQVQHEDDLINLGKLSVSTSKPKIL